MTAPDFQLQPTRPGLPNRRLLLDIILKEWLFCASAVSLVVTSVYLDRLPSFSGPELQVLFLLAALFVAVRGLERSNLILRLARLLEKGPRLACKLVAITFGLSMVVTNDVALVLAVPLTLALETERKELGVILEALAANAGSALTPFGNPQNLFIYWIFRIKPAAFLSGMAPLAAFFFILLMLAALLVRNPDCRRRPLAGLKIKSTAFVYLPLLLVIILAVLHVLPLWTAGSILLYAVLFDRQSLRIDFILLLTFFCFFGLADNILSFLPARIEHTGHIFIFSALASQVISNVPAALLFAKFTAQWKALLWGTNVGGFGSLVGSLANLIAYRIYVTHKSADNKALFAFKFMALGYVAFFIGLGLYFAAGGP